jgi:hypothetical protein
MFSTIELYLSGLIGTACHPVMQKIRKIEFFFENRLHIYLLTNKKHYSDDDLQLSPLTRTLGIPYLIWEPLRLLLFTVCTCVYTFRPRLICSLVSFFFLDRFTWRTNPIPIIDDPDNQRPDLWSSTVFFFECSPDFRKEKCFLEGSQTSPVCSSGKNNIQMKISKGCWWNGSERKEPQ